MRFAPAAIFAMVLGLGSLAVPLPAEAATIKTPTVELVSPMRVKVGGTIVIRGKNFSSRRVRNTVAFRGRRTVLVMPSSARHNRLVVKVPGRVHLLLATRKGQAIPTRLRLQVLTRGRGRRTARISKKTGPNHSPVVVPRAGPVITSGPSGNTTDHSATFAFSSTEPVSYYTCKLDQGAWQRCASPTPYSNLALGRHQFFVRPHTAAGDAYAAPATRSWTVVNPDPPDVTITSGPPETNESTTAAFDFSSTQAGSVECSLDLAEFSPCSSPTSYSDVAPGGHQLRVRVTNENGSDVDTWQWTTTAPPSGSDAPADPGVLVQRF
jgi:hypothetical protein